MAVTDQEVADRILGNQTPEDLATLGTVLDQSIDRTHADLQREKGEPVTSLDAGRLAAIRVLIEPA